MDGGNVTKVLVFDDDDAFRQKIESEVPKDLGLDVRALEQEEFVDGCRALADRERDWRASGAHGRRDPAAMFDGASVVLLDFNLAGLSLGGKGLPGTTGAEIATRLRCFSNAGVIVNLNRWGTETEFRLEMMWPADTYADLDIAATEVGSRAVWLGDADPLVFAPTYRRPILPLLQQLASRERDVEESWDAPVREFFGFAEDEWEALPRSVRAFVGRRDAGTVTLDEFVRESGSGLRSGDVTKGNAEKRPPYAVRIAAMRLGAWLELRAALLDDCLIGVGALARLLPQSIAPKDGDWNGLVRDTGALELACVEEFRLARRDWSTRPLWWWSRIQRDSRFPENREPWGVEPPPVVFASDSGAFIRRKEARLFRADLELNSDRFVGAIPGVAYRPDDYLMRA